MSPVALIFWLIGLGLAVLVDVLSWGVNPSLSYLIWVALALAAGLTLAARRGRRLTPSMILLAALALVMAALNMLRADPFTRFLGAAGAAGLLVLLVMVLPNPAWPRFALADYGVAFFRMVGNTLVLPFRSARKLASEEEVEAVEPPARTRSRAALPYVRGILLAIPLLLVFGALLSSADPIFERYLHSLYSWFEFERLPEYLFRLTYILIFTVVFTGALLHAIQSTEGTHLGVMAGKPEPFLGWTETAIVLGAVNLLFLAFVVIQFRYLFGGEANINAAGFTYAEYARRGFSELVFVAVLSLGLFWLLATIARRPNASTQRAFNALGLLLLALVLVMLVSAAQRVLLYQDAYGFTRLRTYTLVAIPWLGSLILAAGALLLSRRTSWLVTAIGGAALAFALTVGLLNVDALIVDRNVSLAEAGQELDGSYLLQLSDSAVPAIARALDGLDPQSPIYETLAAVLSCRTKQSEGRAETDWRSYHVAEAQAARILSEHRTVLAEYPVDDVGGTWMVRRIGQPSLSCFQPYMD